MMERFYYKYVQDRYYSIQKISYLYYEISAGARQCRCYFVRVVDCNILTHFKYKKKAAITINYHISIHSKKMDIQFVRMHSFFFPLCLHFI